LQYAVGSKKIACEISRLNSLKKLFNIAMKNFTITKSFPKEKRYSLTDQIRRSSRSVSSDIAEAYRKSLYPKNFISRLTNAMPRIQKQKLS
jgi:four helix bundle protein